VKTKKIEHRMVNSSKKVEHRVVKSPKKIEHCVVNSPSILLQLLKSKVHYSLWKEDLAHLTTICR
jgi:hypothetical protein